MAANLINSDVLMEAVREDFDGVCVYDVSPSEAISDFERIVDSAPTVDAVEVVRCKDCIYAWIARRSGNVTCVVHKPYKFGVDPYGFCNLGISRKDAKSFGKEKIV